MTVGLELERLTGFGLFHNHMTVDPVMRLFPFDSPGFRRLVTEFRQRVFEEYAATESKGLIFTFVWVLDNPQDRAFVDRTMKFFADRGVRCASLNSKPLRPNDCDATPHLYVSPRNGLNVTSRVRVRFF